MLKVVFDNFPHPLFIIDADARIREANRAAAEFTGDPLPPGSPRLCGDVLHCVNARAHPNACGTTTFCETCGVRLALDEALKGCGVHRRKDTMQLLRNGKTATVHLLITSAPLLFRNERLSLFVLEDITEFTALQEIIPICSGCKKVRTDPQYWQSVESYLKSRLDLKFSHGLCPDCLRKYDPDAPPAGSDKSGIE